MEGADAVKYLYQPSLALELFLLLGMLTAILRPALLVMLATCVVLLRPNERMALSIPFMQVLVPVLSLALLLNAGTVKERRPGAAGRYLDYFVLLALAETLVFHSGDFVTVFTFVVVNYLVYYTTLVFMADDAGTRLLSRTVVFCCFLICLEPLYYHLTEPVGSEIWNVFHLPKSGRLQAWGMWQNANETAFIACMGIANLVFLAAKYKGVSHYLASLLAVPFFAVIIFLTASRAGFASLLLIFLPSVVLARNKVIRVVAVVAIVGAVLVAHTLTPVRTDAQGSADDRAELRRRGKLIVEENPLFGIGLLQARYYAGGRPLHNTYLQAFAETGVPGGVLLMTFLIGVGRRLYAVCAVNRERSPYLVFVLGLYCSSIFYFFWGNQLLSIFFFLVTAQLTIAIRTAAGAATPSSSGVGHE